MNNCELCLEDGGEIIAQNELLRIIYVEDKNYPGYVRVILNRHVKEMSDLENEEASQVFATLIKIEKTIRDIYIPDKVNVASLGNVVPHLHWHIIPRYKHDLHFPNPIWGEIVNHDYIPNSQLLELKSKLFAAIKINFFILVV